MDFLKTVLPTLATALGGPLAGGAAAYFADKLGLPDKTVDAVVSAVKAASPEQIAQLRQIDADLKRMYVEAGIRLEEVAAADRDSARKREVSTSDKTPRNLAYLYGAAFFLAVASQIGMGVYGVVMPSGAEKTLDMLLGVLTGMVLGSKEYFFGTSAGSQAKTELLARGGRG
jgi:hypothetical protein